MSEQELVKITIDGQEVEVPAGINVIEAARYAGIEIPHYCYHPDLSVPGNCRMCQCKVEGSRKMDIACNTQVREGMVVNTQESSEEVADAQRATLEFILINHPLDCTICDQAGHCKLQDYYYEYNSKPSRFSETKQHKVKAQPLGPDIMFDGERCIVCTRCVRFCDEVTETSELGVFNRGDKSVIATSPERELDNPLSGCVVDLCPVGALTHTRWRFNSRIWYTNRTETVCAGCSTGCNAEVCERDGEIIQIKGRYNKAVSGEWMCNEGRYGFDRFQPVKRLGSAQVGGEDVGLDVALKEAASTLVKDSTAMLLSPMLTLEEMWLALQVANAVGISNEHIAVQIKKRELSEKESLLISPDFAPNARGAALLGLASDGNWRTELEDRYAGLLRIVGEAKVDSAIFVGDFSLLSGDSVSGKLLEKSVYIGTKSNSSENESAWQGQEASAASYVCLPGRTVNEKRGSFVNKDGRLQRLSPSLSAPIGTYPEWMLLVQLAKALGKDLVPPEVTDERSLFRHMASAVDVLSGVKPSDIGSEGCGLLGEDIQARKVV